MIVVDESPEQEPGAKQEESLRPDTRAHAVRVGMVDLRAESVLLRLGRSLDPSSYAPSVQAAHGRAITGCLIAMEVCDAMGN
jgi:hypothetical protein